MSQRRPREKSAAHLDLVRQLPCIVCGNDIETEAAHVRFSDSRVAKINSGLAQKPHDKFTLPLCSRHHREQHNHGDERLWWESKNIDPIFYALALYACDGDHQTGAAIVRNRLDAMN